MCSLAFSGDAMGFPLGFDGPVENGVVVGNGFLHDMAATLEETGRWY